MFSNDILLNYKLYGNSNNNANINNNSFGFIKNDMENYMKQLIQLKAEHTYLQNNLTLFNAMVEQFKTSNSESIAEILQNLMKQLTNFNKRMITIEEGFFKTAKMITCFEQAKEYLNRNVSTLFQTTTPTLFPSATSLNIQQQPNLFNDFLNIENLTTPKAICDELKKVFSNDQISIDKFATMVTKCTPQYLIDSLNCQKNWFELTIKSRNLYKDVFVWLKLNNLNELQNNIINRTIVNNNMNNHDANDNDVDNNNNEGRRSFVQSPITTTAADSNETTVSPHGTLTPIQQEQEHQQQQQQQLPQRSRTKKRLNKRQYEELVKFYTLVSFYPKSKQLNELGRKLDLSLKFIQNWFANRRRRDNLDRTVSKRKIVNCKLNKCQKDALNALFCKNPYASKEEMTELAETYDLDYGAVSRWLNIKRSTNERLLLSKSGNGNGNGNTSDCCDELSSCKEDNGYFDNNNNVNNSNNNNHQIIEADDDEELSVDYHDDAEVEEEGVSNEIEYNDSDD